MSAGITAVDPHMGQYAHVFETIGGNDGD